MNFNFYKIICFFNKIKWEEEYCTECVFMFAKYVIWFIFCHVCTKLHPFIYFTPLQIEQITIPNLKLFKCVKTNY